MTTETKLTTEEIAFNLYAEEFGEKAAKRNAGRIAKLAELVRIYGAANIKLRTVYTSGWTEVRDLKESGAIILGSTATSSDKSTHVVADCSDENQSVSNPPQKKDVVGVSTKSATVDTDAYHATCSSCGHTWNTYAWLLGGELAALDDCPKCGADALILKPGIGIESDLAPRSHRGQLWEECPQCGAEPVCAECGYCPRHCNGASVPFLSISGEIYGGEN